LLFLRLSGEKGALPQFDYLVGLPSHMSFCPFWLDQLAFYVMRSSDAIWWLGVSSLKAFPHLLDDFYILKGGDRWLSEHLNQSRYEATEDSSEVNGPPSTLYKSILAHAASTSNHASTMVRPIPLVERSMHTDGSCDCSMLSACITSGEKLK
jgi:hypothetical protein